MTTLRNVIVIAGIVGLTSAGTGWAQPTDAETRCQRAVHAAGSRFIAAKLKCAAKCVASARKGATPFSDCIPPYAGTMRRCLGDAHTGRAGAELRFARVIRSMCDPTFASDRDCPECWSNGDCSLDGEAGDRVQRWENMVDTFAPHVFCEQPGADAPETACEVTTARRLSKLAASIGRCFDRCVVDVRRGAVPADACTSPAVTDPATVACLHAAYDKSIRGIDARCGDVGARPDCFGPADYPSGAEWTNFVALYLGGTVRETFCDSPSAAFVE